MGKAVSDRLVEVLARDLPAEPMRVADEDPALAVALAQHHRLRDRVVGAHEARRARHDLRRRPQRASGPREGGEDELARLGERAPVHRRGSLLMPAAAQHRGDRGRVELGQARAHDAEDAAVHLHEADEGQRVGEIDDLVRQVGDAVDVGRPRDGRHEHLEAGDRVRLERRDEGVEQGTLLLRERRAKVLGDDLLARAVAQAPGERLGVADAHAGIGERPRVLVDAERENRRLEGRDGELPLGQDPHHRRRQGAVLREDEVLGLHPVRRLAGMVVEDDDLDGRIAGDALELAQALRVHGLDDDQPPDRAPARPGLPRAARARRRAGGRTP